mmetsp:Transcript_95890/g.213314  ORF Transcript_95890/g.213314 Transcript_95890/m.213314 type:complete len:553 (+) Transcript_95890:84-1742(+)
MAQSLGRRGSSPAGLARPAAALSPVLASAALLLAAWRARSAAGAAFLSSLHISRPRAPELRCPGGVAATASRCAPAAEAAPPPVAAVGGVLSSVSGKLSGGTGAAALALLVLMRSQAKRCRVVVDGRSIASRKARSGRFQIAPRFALSGDEPEVCSFGKAEEPVEKHMRLEAQVAAGLAIVAAVAIASDPALAADVVENVKDAAQAAGGAIAEKAGDAAAAGDAALAGDEAEGAETAAAAPGGFPDIFGGIVQFNSGLIAGFDDVLETKFNLPNTFGFAIIAYTILIKAVTFPLNQSALRTNAMMQLIAPKVKQIQTKYAQDSETQNRLLLRLYDDCGVNPLGGCIPSIVQVPIFFSLYRSINELATKNVRFQEPFLWIPNLSGPVKPGEPSLDWLVKSKFADHFEPLVGWQNAGLYVILPILLIVSQYITSKVANPQQAQASGPAGWLVNVAPLFIGYTSLVSPSGLGIYWFMNNLLTNAQTTLIKNSLADEFPEYKKMIDGTKEKEDAEKAAQLQAEREAEKLKAPTGLGQGFSMPSGLEELEEEVAEEE